MRHVITKSFKWSMGHRVHNQKLDAVLSCGSSCKCKHLHGHSYTAVVTLEAEQLEKSMVMDFTDLKFFQKWIDNNLDHKFMLHHEDPLMPTLTLGIPTKKQAFGVHVLDTSNFLEAEDFDDLTASFVIVDYVPTSEEIAQHLAAVVSEHIPDHVQVRSVMVSESESSSASYKPGA